MDRLDFNDDGKVDFKEFKEFHRLFPSLFYPAFRIQVPECAFACMGSKNQLMIFDVCASASANKWNRYTHEPIT